MRNLVKLQIQLFLIQQATQFHFVYEFQQYQPFSYKKIKSLELSWKLSGFQTVT